MRIIVEREYGNRAFTMGTLSIEGQNFSCTTLEKRIPDNWRGMKNFVAIPEGTYDLAGEMVLDSLHETLRISTTGTYRKAVFTDKGLDEMTPGSIQLCQSVDTKTGRGKLSKEKFEIFLDLLEDFRQYGIMPWQFKKGCAELVVKRSSHFVFLNVDVSEEEEEEYQWGE